MANYANTKSIIAQNIYTNHEGQVTAEMVKTAANEIVNTLIAGGYLYAGIAKLTPTQTNPGSPDANVFYIATEPGTYTNFVGAGGSLVVADGEVAIFKYNGSWSKEVTGTATAAQVTELGRATSGIIPYVLLQGTIDPITGAFLPSNLTRIHTDYVIGKLYIKTKSGYYINRICEYNPTTHAFIQTLFSDNQNRLTEYTYDDTNAICVVFSKQNDQSEITPEDEPIDVLYDLDSLYKKILENTANILSINGRVNENAANIGVIKYTLNQGSINPTTGAFLPNDSTRIRTDYLGGKLYIKTKSGYYINRICEYNPTTHAFIQTLFSDNKNRLTEYTYDDTNAICVVFSQQNILTPITPAEDTIDVLYNIGSLSQKIAKNTADIATLTGEITPPILYDTFDLENPQVKQFIASAAYDDSDYTYTQVTDYLGYMGLRMDRPRPVRLTWDKNSASLKTIVLINTTSASVLGASSMMFDVPWGDNYLDVENLVPGKTYYYGVYAITPTGIVELKTGSFTTTGQERMIAVKEIDNVRDIGGWLGESGKRVKYEMVYRGPEFNPSGKGSICVLSKESINNLRSVAKIKAEIDLRGNISYLYNTRNNTTSAASLLGADITYLASTYVSYVDAITSGTNLATIIAQLIDNFTNNKPTYIHCAGGCDRTGTIVTLILGVLGVSESDLAKEYELTSFSLEGVRTRNSSTYNYSGMIAAIKQYSGATLQDKIATFMTTDGGVTSEQIASLKSLLLNP